MCPIKENVLTVCVVYNENLLDIPCYRSLLKFSDDVLIIDNSPISKINTLPNENWEIMKFPNNPGLGFAYNRAAEYAINKGYSWLLLSDQDTQFPIGYHDIVKAVIESSSDYKLLCPIVRISHGSQLSPTPLNHYFPKLIKYPSFQNSQILLKKFAIINSGLVINLNSYFKAGGYNEDVFLDFSDFQFIERISNHEKYAFVMDCTCIQDFSNDSKDKNRKLERFKLFCKSAKKCHFQNLSHKILFKVAVLKRLISLSIEFRVLDFAKIYINYYVL